MKIVEYNSFITSLMLISLAAEESPTLYKGRGHAMNTLLCDANYDFQSNLPCSIKTMPKYSSKNTCIPVLWL